MLPAAAPWTAMCCSPAVQTQGLIDRARPCIDSLNALTLSGGLSTAAPAAPNEARAGAAVGNLPRPGIRMKDDFLCLVLRSMALSMTGR